MSLEKVTELLKKQRLVEGMVHNQNLPRQALVETVLHRQHMAELKQLLTRLPAVEIGAALESLALDEARQLWQQVAVERQGEILWEVSEQVREALVGGEEGSASESQMNAFELVDGRLSQVSIRSRKDLERIRPVWIDLLGASKTERSCVGEHYGVELPDPGEATDLEVSSRFNVEENQDIYLHSNFLLDREGDSRSIPLVFVLHQGILFSVRNEELPVFRLQRRRARNQPGLVSDCNDLLPAL